MVTRNAAEPTPGLRAGLAVVARRPDDVLRVAYARGVRGEIGDLLRWAGRERVPCTEASEAELGKLADSTQHEGLCVVARARKWLPAAELSELLGRERGRAIALDRVRNPYNVGAVLRSAAFFGLKAALLGAPAPHPGLAPTAIRVAEGGVEHLALARTTDLADTLARLRSRGALVVGADGHARASAFGAFAQAAARPAILVVGNEREGLAERVRAQCDAVVAIPGSGAVESLNVAVAAGVLVAEMMRPARA
jgi:TrmH RNA methyltransferase